MSSASHFPRIFCIFSFVFLQPTEITILAQIVTLHFHRQQIYKVQIHDFSDFSCSQQKAGIDFLLPPPTLKNVCNEETSFHSFSLGMAAESALEAAGKSVKHFKDSLQSKGKTIGILDFLVIQG